MKYINQYGYVLEETKPLGTKIKTQNVSDDEEVLPETLGSDIYIPGYLRTQIGNLIRVEFLIGTQLTDRTGILTDVGASFIVLRAANGDLIVCDMFSIKFVTILQSNQ